jgi:N-methylhydantoinase B/oxoprolinase/acetone carboxylase alpha subunit
MSGESAGDEVRLPNGFFAGAGRYRGGLGGERRYTLREEANLTTAWERITCPPCGLSGGHQLLWAP